MFPEPIDSLSNLSCLAKKKLCQSSTHQKLFEKNSNQRITALKTRDKWQINAITKGKIEIRPSVYPQIEPSTEASSTTLTILNQTVTTLTNAPQIRNQKTQQPKGLSIEQPD